MNNNILKMGGNIGINILINLLEKKINCLELSSYKRRRNLLNVK